MGLKEDRERMRQQRIEELARWAQQRFKFTASGPPQEQVVAEATKRWDIPSYAAKEYASDVKQKFRRS